jgi:hypothetical protein
MGRSKKSSGVATAKACGLHRIWPSHMADKNRILGLRKPEPPMLAGRKAGRK